MIPVYNVERYLRACLDSVLRQDRDDYEIILVNDGSTDDSLDICRCFSRENPRLPVRIVNQENAGLLAARRAGFAQAIGDYCWSIDSDDMIRDDALDLIDEVIEATGVDMVFFDYSLHEDFRATMASPPFDESGYFGKEDLLQVCRAYCRGRMYPLVTKVVKRECLHPERTYAEFGRLNVSEDDLQDIGILDSIDTAFYIHLPLYYYRQNGESITGRYRPGMLEEQALVEKEKRAAAERWASACGDESIVRDYAAGALSEWYFVCRKCLTLTNRKELLDELTGISDLSALLEEENTLRLDKRLFYRMVTKGLYLPAWLYCRAMMRASAVSKGIKLGGLR